MIRNEAPDYGYEYKAGEYEATFERTGGMDEREILPARGLGQEGLLDCDLRQVGPGVHQLSAGVPRIR